MNPEDLIIRPGTSDEGTWHDVFDEDKAYHLPTPNDFIPRDILDIGAYVGYTSIDFAAKYPEAKIIAVEPDPDNFSVLAQNVLISKLQNIRVVNCAYACFNGRGRLIGDAFNAKRLIPDQNGDITVWHIDFLIGKCFDYVKMDIEGTEQPILKNKSGWSNNIDLLKVELHDYDSYEALQDLHDLGFEYYWIDSGHPACVVGANRI